MKGEEYLSLLNGRCDFEGEFLKNQREKARARGVPVMLEDTARFLANIIELKKPKNILEIGMAVGYSGSLMLRHTVKECKLTTIEIDEVSLKTAKDNFKAQGLTERVRIFQGDAGEIIPLMSGKFDFIFVDGPKSKYIQYLPNIMNMLSPQGVIVSDNVLFRDLISGEVKAHKRMNTIVRFMREYLDEITTNDKLFTQVYDVGDGVAVSVLKDKNY